MAIRSRGADGGEHWPTTVASLTVGAAFLALWFWLLPSWRNERPEAVKRSWWAEITRAARTPGGPRRHRGARRRVA